MSESNIKLRIEQGTGRLTGRPLCFSCSHAAVREGDITCHYYSDTVVVRKAIFNCSVYNNKSIPSLHDMREIAWTLGTNKGGKSIGFKPPNRKDLAPPED